MSEGDKETPATPWLSKTYLQDVLQKHYKNDSIQVLNINSRSATAKGENYTSDMQRIQVEYASDQAKSSALSLIVKVGFQGHDHASEIMNAYGLYEREMEMYMKILPKLTALLREVGDLETLYAEALHVDYEHKAIILEDLSLDGYAIADRLQRLDMKHAKLVLNKLAKIHAAGAVLNERMPGIFAHNYDRGMFNRKTPSNKLHERMLSTLTNYVAQNTELKEKYLKKLQTLTVERLGEYGRRAFDVNNAHFMTLIHGDAWTNNLMFQYDNNKIPINLIPVDYQIATWTSPTLDLQYFFNSSLQENLRLNAQPYLLKYYYDIFVGTLRALKFRGYIPSLHKLRLEFEMRNFYGLFTAFIFQPFMMCEDTDGADFNILVSPCEVGANYRNKLFKNIQIQKSIQHLLPIFDQKGLLDYME